MFLWKSVKARRPLRLIDVWLFVHLDFICFWSPLWLVSSWSGWEIPSHRGELFLPKYSQDIESSQAPRQLNRRAILFVWGKMLMQMRVRTNWALQYCLWTQFLPMYYLALGKYQAKKFTKIGHQKQRLKFALYHIIWSSFTRILWGFSLPQRYTAMPLLKLSTGHCL